MAAAADVKKQLSEKIRKETAESRASRVKTSAVDDDDSTSDSDELSGSDGGEGSVTESEASVSNGQVSNHIYKYVY